jgi:hypothetical protein
VVKRRASFSVERLNYIRDDSNVLYKYKNDKDIIDLKSLFFGKELLTREKTRRLSYLYLWDPKASYYKFLIYLVQNSAYRLTPLLFSSKNT